MSASGRAYKSNDPNYETIYQKRLKQIQEDFPIPDEFISNEQFRSATGH